MWPPTPGPRRRRLAAAWLPLLLAAQLAAHAWAAIFTVNVITDDPANPTLAGTLRAALTAAAASPDTVNRVVFNLPAPAIVTLLSPLPAFDLGTGRRLEIDGAITGAGGVAARVALTTSDTTRVVANIPSTNASLALSNLDVSGFTFVFSANTGAEARGCRFSGAGKAPGKSFWVQGTFLAEGCSFEDHGAFDGSALDAFGGAIIAYGSASSFIVRQTAFARNSMIGVSAYSSVGAAFFLNGVTGPAIIDGCSFTGNYARRGAAIYMGPAGGTDVQITNTTFDSNTAETEGGALALDQPKSLLIQSVIARNNIARDGGSVGGSFWIQAVGARILDTVVSGGTAVYGGGCLLAVSSDNITLQGVSFSGCSATYGGGAYFSASVGPSLSDVTFDACVGSTDGGGLYMDTCAGAALHNIGVTNCSASVFGGGARILNSAGSVLTNYYGRGNKAGHGAGLFLDTSPNAVVADSTFTFNVAGVQGAGMIGRSSDGLQVVRSTFLNNTANNGPGGGLWLQACTNATVTDVTAVGNTATGNVATAYGGGVLLDATPGATLLRCVLAFNKAIYGGGLGTPFRALYTQNQGIVLDTVTVTGNSGDPTSGFIDAAAGVFLSGASGSVVRNSTFHNNGPASGGGLAFSSSNNVRITASSFTDNFSSQWGGGIALYQTTGFTVDQCLFQGNSAGHWGSAVHLKYANNISISSTSIRHNTNPVSDGAISLNGDQGISIGDSVIENNSGGALYTFESASTLQLARTTIRNNNALARPVIYLGDATTSMTVLDSSILDNASPAGGAYLGITTSTTFIRSTFARNGNGGPGLNLNSATLTLRESTVDSNGASSAINGSQILAAGSSTVVVESCTIVAASPPRGPSLVASGPSAATTFEAQPAGNNAGGESPPHAVSLDEPGQANVLATAPLKAPPLSIPSDFDVAAHLASVYGGTTAGANPGGSGGARRRLLHRPATAQRDTPSAGAHLTVVSPATGFAASAGGPAPAAVEAPASTAPARQPKAPPLLDTFDVYKHLPPVVLPADAPASDRAALLGAGRSFIVSGAAAAPARPAASSRGDARAEPARSRRRLMAAPGNGGVDLVRFTIAAALTGSAIQLNGGSSLAMSNSIVACPYSDCIAYDGGSTAAVAFSLLRGTWGAPGQGNIDSTVAPTRLGPLQDNGGLTLTRMPDLGSPSIDAGSNALLLQDGYDIFDQRGLGYPRIVCFVVDMGAVEAPFRAPALYNASVPAVFNTSRNYPVAVPAPGVIANAGPFQQFIGNGMQAVLVKGPMPGATLELRPDGSFNYTPARDFVGTDSFAVLARSSCGLSRLDSPPATFYVYVAPRDIPPVVGNVNFATDEDTTLTVSQPGVLAASTDQDGDTLSVELYFSPTHGILTPSPNGAFTYTPAPNYNGQDSFAFIVADGFGGTGGGVAYINIAPVNDPPVAVNQNYTTPENTALIVPAPGVLTGATDVEGDSLSAELTAGPFGPGPARGTLIFWSDGRFQYYPDAGFTGTDTFVFGVSDGHGGTATATAFITVEPVNQAPYALVSGARVTSGSPSVTITAFRNTPLVIPALGLLPSGQPAPPGAALFGDPENDTLALALVSPPGLGSASVAASTGVVTFLPPYMKKTDPDGLSTSMVLQAQDPGGLKSPLLTVKIVIGGKPPLEIPSINVLTVRLTGCSAGGVNVDAFSVTAGSLTLLDKNGQPTVTGVPTGMIAQVAPVGSPWPTDTSGPGDKKSRCILKAPAKVAASASRNWDYGACGRCLACLKEMAFNCTAGPYMIRLQAAANNNAAWADSTWSAPYIFQPTCEGKALSCFPKP